MLQPVFAFLHPGFCLFAGGLLVCLVCWFATPPLATLGTRYYMYIQQQRELVYWCIVLLLASQYNILLHIVHRYRHYYSTVRGTLVDDYCPRSSSDWGRNMLIIANIQTHPVFKKAGFFGTFCCRLLSILLLYFSMKRVYYNNLTSSYLDVLM